MNDEQFNILLNECLKQYEETKDIMKSIKIVFDYHKELDMKKDWILSFKLAYYMRDVLFKI